MTILFVEDNEYKNKKVMSFLSTVDNVTIIEAMSYNSAVKKAISNSLDLLILDMSLPTFDINHLDTGGRHRMFGGRDVVLELQRRGILMPFVVLTQFTTFDFADGVMSISDLREEFSNSFGKAFLGIIFYEVTSSAWREELSAIIGHINAS